MENPVNTPPTVSVIVPTYNRADFIGEALGSVCSQTFTDFEVIVVDDGSTDRTEEVVKSIGDPRIRYHWQENSGFPSVARNAGIRMTRGRYIAFLDSDDLWLPGKLELQVSYMESNPETALTCTNAEAFTERGQKWRLVRFGLASKRTMKDLLKGNFIATLTVMVRKECLDSVGLFNEDSRLKGNEDYELWLRISARYPFKYLGAVTARYRVHEENLVGTGEANFTERGIDLLRGLDGGLEVPRPDFRRALTAHYRRLAYEYGLAGNKEGYMTALLSSWKARPDWKTGTLLLFYALTGFGPSRWATATAKHLKYTLDRGVWWLQSHL